MLPSTEPYPSQRLKLIFNPMSGSAAGAPDRLQVIVAALQAAHYLPEVYLVEPECDLGPVVKDALRRGHRLFAACGGDGTIDSVAAALAGTAGTLGIVPAGTRNNVAFSLGSVIQAATGGAEDQRLRRYKVRRVVVETNPPMPVVLDGFPLTAAGPLRLSVRRRALNIIGAPGVPRDQAPAAQPHEASDPKPVPGPQPDKEQAPA